MSKRNMLLGLAAGKIGDLVFYRDGGEQRTRTRVIPRNPRTSAQQAQRSKIANASAMYRLLSAVLADSFVSRPSNQSGFNAYSQLAIPTSPYMTRSMAAADCVLPQPAVISKGTLQAMPSTMAILQDDTYVGIFLPGQLASASSVGDVAAALIERYPTLSAGDILTFVMVDFRVQGVTDEGDNVYIGVPTVTTFTLNVASDETLASVGMRLEGSILAPEGYDGFSSEDILASAVVQSRVEGDGRLNVTTESLRLTPAAKNVYDNYSTALARDHAVASYFGGGKSILRD